MTNKGGYRPGAGRPVGVPNRVTTEFREALRDLDQPAVDRLQTLLESKDETIAMRAVELTLSYIHGRPRNEMKIEATSAPKSLSPEKVEDLPPIVLKKLLTGQRIQPEDYEGLPQEILRRIAGIDEVKSESQAYDERE